MEKKRYQLEQELRRYTKEDICIAFSGGVDSSLLLKISADLAKENSAKVYAVTFDTKLHPPCDLEIAARVAGEMQTEHVIITVDELEQEEIRFNPVNRCYLCKYQLFTRLKDFAEEKGIKIILDGTNEDDLHVYRPGIQALKELGIISPLAAAHFTKKEVKELAAILGISVASRPSTPCMATRLPYHTEIQYEILEKIQEGEKWIQDLIGGNVRLRLHGDIVRLEVDIALFGKVMENTQMILDKLKQLGFLYITLDLEGFRSGSMDIGIRNTF